MSTDNTQAAERPAIERLMEQAQVFASAWSIIGGPFDFGSAPANAEEARAELRMMIEAELAIAAAGRLSIRLEGDAYDLGRGLYMQLVYAALGQALSQLQQRAPTTEASGAALGMLTGFMAGAFANAVQIVGGAAAGDLFSQLAKAADMAEAKLRAVNNAMTH